MNYATLTLLAIAGLLTILLAQGISWVARARREYNQEADMSDKTRTFQVVLSGTFITHCIVQTGQSNEEALAHLKGVFEESMAKINVNATVENYEITTCEDPVSH